MLASLIAAFASSETYLWLRESGRATLAYAGAAVLALCGAGFFIGALFIAAARRYGDLGTAFGFGVGFFALAALTLAIYKSKARTREQRATARRAAELQTIAVAGAATMLPTLVRGGFGIAALATPVVGFGAYLLYRKTLGSRKRRISTEP